MTNGVREKWPVALVSRVWLFCAGGSDSLESNDYREQARLLVALVRRAREVLRPDRQGCVKCNVWSIPLDYRTAVLEAHATSGRVGPAQRVKSQLLAGDAYTVGVDSPAANCCPPALGSAPTRSCPLSVQVGWARSTGRGTRDLAATWRSRSSPTMSRAMPVP